MTASPEPGGVDVLTFGEALASFRCSGPLQPASTLSVSPVGAELNVAIGLARLGHRTRWHGRVGDDALGQLVLRALRGEGVRTSTIVDPAAPTAVMVVVDRQPLGPEVLYHRAGSAGSRLDAADVLRLLDTAPRLLHVTGVTPALSPGAAASVTAAVERARDLDVEVSLDVNHRTKLWSTDRAREVLTPIARQATILIASEDELGVVAHGTDAAARAALLRAAGVRTVVVKRGRHGATSYGPDGVHERAAYPVAEVDSIGAGDAFCAGYLSALLDGLDEPARLDRGCRAGAFVVSGRGDWDRSPTRRELDLFASGNTEASR